MGRTISGSKNGIPGGLAPLEWANEVWSVMDQQDVGQDEAKSIVAARYAKAEERPPRDKMVTISRNKGVANG